MSDNLQSIYYVVKNREAQWRKPTVTQNDNSGSQLEKEAIQAIHDFPVWFIQRATALESAEALRLHVNIHVTAFTDLLDRLEKIPARLARKANENGKESCGVTEIKNALLTAFYWLKRTFATHIAKDQPLPVRLAKEASEVLLAELPRIQQQLSSSGMDARWVAAITEPLATVIRAGGFTCHQLDYFRALYAGVQNDNATLDSNKAVVKWLWQQNLNLPAIIEYAIEQYRHEVADSMSLEARLEEVEQYIRLAGSTQELSLGFYPEKPSCKDAFVIAFTGERQYLKEKGSNLANIYGSNIYKQALAKNPSPLTTTLSVSQLAVFCRLLSDCNILQHGNQTELLKMIAGALQTTRTLTISPESLRVKYYAPDAAAINIIKEHLLQMLSQLKKY